MTVSIVRRCPQCSSERPAAEPVCENMWNGNLCGWPLLDEPLRTPGPATSEETVGQAPAGVRACPNGHPLDAGDDLCLHCGALAAPAPSVPAVVHAAPAGVGGATVTADDRRIANWRVLAILDPMPGVAERFLVEDVGATLPGPLREEPAGDGPPQHFAGRRTSSGRAVVWLYERSAEPDPSIYPIVHGLPRAYVPVLLDSGRVNDRAFDAWEVIEGGHLGALPAPAVESFETLRPLVVEMSQALSALAEVGLRHRDLRPDNILVRSTAPLDLVLAGFGSAKSAELDLELAPPLALTRYSAPEAIVGAVSAASDWWSVGVILLERVTHGACFDGVNDAAFQLHVVTRRLRVPSGLDPVVAALLLGLLTSDPSRRWQGAEVRRWLDGETQDVPGDDGEVAEPAEGPMLPLAGKTYRGPAAFALAAADAARWDEARELLARGALVTWLEARGTDTRVVATVRTVVTDEGLDSDARLALTLMALNPDLPLLLRGDLVTPGWLLSHPVEGYALVTGRVTDHLRRMGREAWLVGLRTRADAVRARAESLEITLDDERLRVALLATSRTRLEAEWANIRRLFPDTDHAGLASLVGRRARTEEELVILVSAELSGFTSAVAVMDGAVQVAERAGVTEFDRAAAGAWLERSRREVYEEMDRRLHGFARCGNATVDRWADGYRLERRIDLARALVLLAVPASIWTAPPRQQYVSQLLGFFSRRVAASVQQGPLVRLIVSRNSARLDLTELGSARRPSAGILDHLLRREEVPVEVDPAVFAQEPAREARLRRLVTHASNFRRDTGIDGLYLGFPFVVFRDARGPATRAPRIAPVLLWPIHVDAPTGDRGRIRMGFDREREEVRLNPALEPLLGSHAAARWREAADDVRGRNAIRASDVMDVFGTLAAPVGRTLATLPTLDVRVDAGQTRLHCAAVLFHCDFSGQGIAEDLRAMASRPVGGTALEVAIRVGGDAAAAPLAAPVPEAARYLVARSDPSQDKAVLAARRAPGLLVEGPPGTGKSQTIVNVIADSIGRGEKVLVVCQKQAALRVVEKRLEAERLGDRLFVVTDVNTDRTRVLKDLREHLARLRPDAGDVAVIERERAVAAARVESLEASLNRQHAALHAIDAASGRSYRALVGELIGLEAGAPPVSAPALRTVVGGCDRAALEALEDECIPLASTWLAAKYEDSPLVALRTFATDDGLLAALTARFQAFVEAEQQRDIVVQAGGALEIGDPAPHRAWLEAHVKTFLAMQVHERTNLANWLPLFEGQSADSGANRLMANLEEVSSALDHLAGGAGLLAGSTPPEEHGVLFRAMVTLPAASLAEWCRVAERATRLASLLGRLAPSRLIARRKLGRRLRELDYPDTDEGMAAFAAAVEQEVVLRRLRLVVAECRRTLGRSLAATSPPEPHHRLAEITSGLLAELRAVAGLAAAVHAHPAPTDAKAAVLPGTREALESFIARTERGFARHRARLRSVQALEMLGEWFLDDWTAARRAAIASDESNADRLERLASALLALAAYQRFRIRAAELSDGALRLFATLRASQDALSACPSGRLEEEVRRTIAREARLAWKARMEVAEPALLMEAEEIDRHVRTLAAEDARLRNLNQTLLAADPATGQVADATDWEDVTRLRGPRARRLREVIDRGVDLGLMRLRPVWLMNPDVASRLLPLRTGLFDLVVFDEASQLPVEFALPALYRARRAVVSGDEKQMPPTSFFVTRLENDEQAVADGDEIDDGISQAERAQIEEAWDRREIKDCPDLLSLARTVLPSTLLEIHYRSLYRELIAFSNAAFYDGRLHVPVRHPDAEVRRARPLDVIRVSTPYIDQTNRGEAERVVKLLAEIWDGARPGPRPSVGVVTFNRRQADLIDDLVEERAEADVNFRRVLAEEMERTQDGEDMGFFVKNLENVQGDERDVIVFSTTFGRDAGGAFRRYFGVLGQRGGERRLNVAITRARQRVVLVTSMPVGEISDLLHQDRAPRIPRDYLQAYLDYATKLSDGDLPLARALTSRLVRGRDNRDTSQRQVSTRDGFTADVEAFVRSLGYAPVSGADAGAFALDLAIEDARTGLFGIGIECDAPRHELLATARAREIWRPGVLARSVPRLYRVRSRHWYHHRTDEQRRLAAAIAEALGRGDIP